MPNHPWHTRISLGALCAMLTLPFLNPHHFNPIPTFYQEWTAAVCALLAATVLLRAENFRKLEIPNIALIPLGLAALLLIQLATGHLAFVTQGLIFALYLLWALLLLILGRSLRQGFELDHLAGLFATALLGGALLSVVLLGLQLVDPRLGLGWVFPFVKGSGNLGQANHLNSYLWLGIASAIYLYARRRLGLAMTLCGVLVLLAGASLSGSRSVFIYAAGFPLLALWASRRDHASGLRHIVALSLALLPLTLILQLIFTQIETSSLLPAQLSGERFFQQVSGTSVRLQLWRTGLAIFAEHPWLGAGLGQFPVEAYRLVGAQPDGTFLGGGEHAHNIIVHLLAEFGLFAALLVIVLGLYWWRTFIRQELTAAHWWIAAVLLVFGAHSQLEYPLWYSFFLGIAALLLGMGSTSGLRPRTGASGRLLIALALLLGALTLFNLRNDYRTLEHALNAPLGSEEGQSWKDLLDKLAKLHRESLFAHYVELSYAYQLTIDKTALADKIAVSQQAVRVSPVDLVTYKLAYLLALNGQAEEARIALQRAIATHPRFIPTARQQLAGLRPRYPELAALEEILAAAP